MNRVKKTYPKIGRKTCRSNFEYQVYKVLTGHIPKYSKLEYEPEKIEYSITATYCPDFVITFKNREPLYLETKGYFDYEDRRKMLAVKAQYPHLDIRMIFMKDSVLGKGSKTRYSDWCLKNDFKFAIKEVPADWLIDG